MKKTAIIIMLITIFSKVFGFARDLTLSYYYGASNISDAYLISLTIPSVIFGFIATGITTGYIPMYSRINKEFGEPLAYDYTNNLINILLVISTLVITVGFIFTEQIVKVFALGFEGETLRIAIQFTKITLFGIYFTGLIAVFSGFLNLKGNYIIPTLIGLPLNAIIILSIFLSTNISIIMLVVGTVVATASQLLLFFPYLQKEGYRYTFIFDIKDQHIKNTAIIALPIIIGVSVNQLNVLVDRTIASQIVEGGISALNYANRLNLFVQGIFVLSIVTVLFPTISRMAADNNISGMKKSISDAICGINLLVVPATVGVMIFAEPIVKFLFGRGAFDFQAVQLTSVAFFFYSLGMIGYGLRELLSRAFYAIQDTKTPMINASIAVVLNIILNIILAKYLGIGGLALATSISAIVATLLLGVSLRKKIGPYGMKGVTTSFVKILFASLIMGIIVKLLYMILINSMGASLSLLISIGLGAISYFVIIYFMRIELFITTVGELRRRMMKG